MAQNFVELKEPLISNDTQETLKTGFLNSFIQKKYGIKPKESVKSNGSNADDQEYNFAEFHQQEEPQPKEEAVPDLENVSQDNTHQLIDFKNELKDLVTQNLYSEPHHKDFYIRSTANHELPHQSIYKLALSKSNLNTFAIISQPTSLFKHIQLKEYICLDDYKKLSKIRIRNYINLLRMLSKIDQSQETYQQIKLKLYQVKKLTEYLNLDMTLLYQRLHKNEQIHDLSEEQDQSKSRKQSADQTSRKSKSHKDEDEPNEEEEEKAEEEGKEGEEEKEEEEGENEGEENQDEDENDYGEEESDEEDSEEDGDTEYLNFFKESSISSSYEYTFTRELQREEELWISRAEWLDNMLEELQNKEATKSWVPWVKAKIEELADLDLPLKNAENQPSSQIFYLYDFLEQLTQKFDPKTQYQPDQKVYPEQNNMYPTIKIEQNNINSSDASNKSRFNLREKLCNKIISREQQTDYIMTVFERKAFGNEKIYERRLNFRGKKLSEVSHFELHPSGGYIFISFNLADDSSSTQHQLIFALNAQYKDPKVLKRNSTFITFQDKSLFAMSEVEVKIVKEKKEAEGENPKLKKNRRATIKNDDMELIIDGEDDRQKPDHTPTKEHEKSMDKEEEETETVMRVFEYDLTDFQKVKFFDLKAYGSYYLKNDLESKILGKLKDGFFYKREKIDNEYKFFNYEVFIRNDLYTMEPSDKFDYSNKEQMSMVVNDKGDKALIQFWKDGQLTFMKYNFDPKDKKIKKDSELKLKNEQLTLEKDKCEMRIHSIGSDFVIVFKISQVDKIFIYLNENLITSIKAELDEVSFQSNDKGLSSIILRRSVDEEQISENLVKYSICDMQVDNEKKTWQWSKVQYEILNQHFEVCHPYAFCIYNHDQVILKDLSQRANSGYYYLNNFLSILKGSRPLTVYGIVYNGKLAIHVPIINSNYQSNDFNLRIQQIKTFYQVSDSYKIHGFIRYKSYAFNQDVLSLLTTWSGVVDSKNKLHSEIKIQAKYNSFYIEQWANNKCFARLVISHFHQMVDRKQFLLCDQDMKYKVQSQWLILFQKMEGQSQNIQLYTHEMRGSFNFTDLMSLETVWDYDDDDAANEIHGVYLDTLVEGKISLYIMTTNCLIKKFTSSIPDSYGAELQFEESPVPYNLEHLFKNKAKEQTGDKSANSKKVNLYEQYKGDIFIANSVFYSKLGVVDLNASNIENKCNVGIQFSSIYLKDLESSLKMTYSFNEAKLSVFYKTQSTVVENNPNEYYNYFNPETCYQPKSYNSVMLFVTPLLNSRVIPQFDHRRFRHPIVPIVDKEKACSSVFTLHLRPTFKDDWNNYIKTPITYAKNMKLRFVDLSPGLLIKYFNGVEEQIPFHKFGEEFIDIIRIKQSSDGQYLTLVGTRVGQIQDRFYDQKTLSESNIHQGIFLYKVTVNSIKLVKSFLFAKKDYQKDENISEELKAKLSNKAEIERVLLSEPEIQGPLVGEYDNEYLNDDGDQEYIYPDYDLEYNKYDDEYIEEQRIKKAIVLKEQKILEAARNKGLRRSQTKNYANSPSHRASARENLLHQSDEDAEKDFKRTNTDHSPMDDMDIEIQMQLDQDHPRGITLKHTKELFKGLNIPYLSEENNVFGEQIKQRFNRLTVNEIKREKEDGEQAFEYEEEKFNQKLFTEDEIDKIYKTHKNMYLDVNEHGHLFLVNRMNNTLYFFYQNHGEFKLAKFKYEHTLQNSFVITGADSSAEFLTITAKEKLDDNRTAHRYKVYNIKDMLESDDHTKEFNQSNLECIFDSKTHESIGVIAEKVGSDQYTYEIEDCKVLNNLLILQLQDSNYLRYLKVFDMKSKVLTYYLEDQIYMLSGCKKFVWIRDTNQVYDIQNGLSTFFMWPGDQINTHMYDIMGGFNISEDRTLMVTQGLVQLAFNYMSFEIDDELSGNYFQLPDSKFYKSSQFQYICYKISDYKSVLERIFMDDYDKTDQKSYRQFSEEEALAQQQLKESQSEEDKKNALFEHQTSQNKSVSYLLQYLSERFNSETLDYDHVTHFFFSYYFNQKSIKKGTLQKEPEVECKLLNIFQKMYSQDLDKRVDLIEDILHYVVEQKTVPILQSVINSCFVDFLNTANTSVAFQSYLNNITISTKRMQEIEKFQITSNDLGFIADSHVSPIIDDKFFSKFRQPKETKKDVEITYISLGKLLSDQGEEIMEMLSDKKYLSIMDIPFIKYLVMYQWLQVKHTIHKKLLYPFFVMLGMFTLYCMVIDFKDLQEDHKLFEQVFRWIFAVILFPVLGYFFYVEIIQFIKDPSDYFKSFWNFSDLFSYTLCLLVVIFDRIPQVPASVNRPIASVCLIILWIKLFYFLRVFESTSRLIRMIIEIVNDMKNFLMVLTIGIIGFSGGFYILSQGEEGREEKPRVFMAIIDGYRLAMGDFQLDSFSTLNPADQILAWFLFVIGSLFLVIVLLNLLIAIMGDTFSRVLENITNLSVREKVMLVSENESLFDREGLFKSAQFLIIINEKNLDSVQTDNWDGQINAFKRQMMDRVNTLQTDLDTKMTENQKDLKKRINDQDEKAKKQVVAQEQRIQTAVKNEFVEAITKINEQFMTQQTVLKMQQTMASESMKTMRLMQEQMEQLRSDQAKLSQVVQKVLQVDTNKQQLEEDD